MKYPITPEYILNAPKPLEKLYRSLEAFILQDICSRLLHADNLTSTAIEQIRLLQKRGYDLKDIEKYIKQKLKLSDTTFDSIMRQAVEDNQRYYATVLNATDLLQAEFFNNVLDDEINALMLQTKGTMQNITQSMGFSIVKGGKRTFLPIAQAYQEVLDHAAIKTWSGAQSYNEAIRGAIKELTDSGIRTVTYEHNGKVRTDHIDVAARRAVMTGITQIGSKYSEHIRKEVPTEYIEVSAHRGARDVPRPGIPWASHKAWQGKVYSTRSGDKYPNIYEACGWGEVDGLEGVNCRHMHFPFWDGISERTWTDEQLATLDRPPFTWGGRTFNAFQAAQQMRLFERQLRQVKRELIAYKASGDKEAYKISAARYNKLSQEYADFAKVSDQRMTERGNILEFGYKDGQEALKALIG